jgi:PTH1 family peptidyl-tRNA hydrolase
VTLLAPETFMNKSGSSVKTLVANAKAAERMLVVYDDLDLPFGTGKMSFNRSSGGHKGLESIIKGVKTEAFPRLRIGISPVTSSGKIKKPSGEEAVNKVILKEFSKDELSALKKLSKKVNETLALLVSDGRDKATGFFNS